MPADPSRIARYTTDGVTVFRVDPTIKTVHVNAIDEGETRESFFDVEADAQAMIEERWQWKSNPARIREAIELADTVGLGTTIPIAPAVPIFNILDDSRGISAPGLVRAYAADHNIDRYAIEIIGAPGEFVPPPLLTISGTPPAGPFQIDDTYLFQPTTTGGLPPLGFSLDGALPPGLFFDPATGTVSGTFVAPASLQISGSPATSVNKGDPYYFKPTVTGGSQTVTFQFDGALPPGFAFNPDTGELTAAQSGIPT